MLAPEGLQVGQSVISSNKAVDVSVGNAMPIKEIPVGTNIYNVELKPGAGGKLARSAGTFVQLIAKEGDYAQVRMPSGEMRRILLVCRATIGSIGNREHENITIGKAGRNRWLGWKGHVRGTVMNPVDHPHGGGHGRDHGGRHPVSPTAVPSKGYRTRNNKRTDAFIIKRRSK
jgi:large subunit ribosomal protein L2